MVFCTYCGRSFSRTEHLQRHVLTHTKVRPFKCAICHLSFTRRDLVRKHYKAHTHPEVEAHANAIAKSLQDDHDAGVTSLGGQRVVVACVACAQMKTKCDHQSPCGRCRIKGLTCVPRPSKRALRRLPDTIEVAHPVGAPADSSQTPDLVVLELSTPILDRVEHSQEEEVVPETDGGLPLPSHPEQRDHHGGAQGSEGGHDSPVQAVPPDLTAPQSSSSTRVEDSAGRYIGLPILPHLDWKSLEAAFSPSHCLASPCSPRTAEADVLDNLNWTATNVGALDMSDVPGQTTTGNEGLFAYNMEQSTWQSNFSALDSMMAQYVRPITPDTSMGSAALPQSDSEIARDGGPRAQDSHSDLQDTSPQEGQTPPHVAEEELDRWALGQCTVTPDPRQPYSSPRLDDNPRGQDDRDCTSWSAAVERYRDQVFEPHERIENVCLTEETREWMLVAVQQFLRAGMDSHDAQTLSALLGPGGAFDHPPERCLLLPPRASMQKYLDIFLTTYEPFSPMIPALSLNPNKLASQNSEREATLLLFLMMAFGAMIDPAPRARQFSHTLTEVCRHSLRKRTDSGFVTTRDTLTLHCALLFTVQTSFSGRRAHMELGTAQRHTYLAMMRNAGYFRSDFNRTAIRLNHGENLNACWRAWMDHEIVSRLCYSWVITDQEISLFYDTPPILMLSELEVPLPADESLWMAPDAQKWKEAFEGTRGDGAEEARTSLRELFALFSEDRLEDFGRKLGPMDLRLLLHPLHSVVANFQQVSASLSIRSNRHGGEPCRPRPSYSRTFEEIHGLTRRWLVAFDGVDIHGARLAAVSRAILIQYHLICINLLAPFKTLEAFSRKERPDHMERLAAMIQDELKPDFAELLLHCGQILRLVRGIDVKLRPVWWSVAVYRAAIVLWAYSVSRRFESPAATGSTKSGTLVPLDTLPFLDPDLSHYLRYRVGTSHLTEIDGTVVPIDCPRAVLRTCIETFGRGPRLWRLTKGLQSKLEALYRNWEPVHQQFET